MCIFTGYSTAHKGYICFNPISSTYIISRHVQFIESTFPGRDTVSSLPSPNPHYNPLLLIPTSSNPPYAPVPSLLPARSRVDLPLPTSSTTETHPATPSSTRAPNRSPTSGPPPNTQPELPSVQAEIHPAPRIHPMKTRLQSGITKPRQILNLLTSKINSTDNLTFKQAALYPHWNAAMDEEISALKSQGTWTLVPPPSPTTKIIGSTWKYKTKTHPDGTIDRYKARLVAQGFRQTFGLDYTDTFSPVAKYTSIRLFFLLALHRHWPIHQLDVSNAFLHGTLHDTVYMA